MLHINEDVVTLIQSFVYEGTGQTDVLRKNLCRLPRQYQKVPPTFTEEEAEFLRLLTVTSDGDLNNWFISTRKPQDGIVDLLVQIQRGSPAQRGRHYSMFKKPNRRKSCLP